ncbi:MAG UNVERIFIED_CONTAM: Uma2 family endonuclease [Microcystis novacekii LVE1205-3]
MVEVVSSNWESDYARKVEEYALLGIPEYWIVDYRGLGGTIFIGKPKRPSLYCLSTVTGRLSTTTISPRSRDFSPLFPDLQLCLDEVLPR